MQYISSNNLIILIRACRYIICLTLIVLTVHIPDGSPEIIMDGSMGLSGEIEAINSQYEVKAEFGKIKQSNLFHSFSTFNIQNQETAKFTGPSTIDTILCRVTGGDRSFIDGRITTSFDHINFFFMNPSGVVFGQNAILDVDSFLVTTSDYIKMNDNLCFFSRPIDNEILSSSPPESFGFLEDHFINKQSATISFEGKGEVNYDDTGHIFKEFSVIGENIHFKNPTYYLNNSTHSYDDKPLVESERINLAAVSSPGEIRLLASGLDASGIEELGDIKLTDNVRMNIYQSGNMFVKCGHFVMSNSSLIAKTNDVKDGGLIDIQTQNFDLNKGSYIRSKTDTYAKGCTLSISAAHSVILRGNLESNGQGCTIYNQTEGPGKAGDIEISTKYLTLKDGAQIGTPSNNKSKGQGGNVDIDATELIILSGCDQRDGQGSSILSTSYGKETDAGNIDIQTKELILNDGAQISTTTLGSGDAGDIHIHAENYIILHGKDNKEGDKKQGCTINATSQGYEIDDKEYNNKQGRTNSATSQKNENDEMNNFGNAGSIDMTTKLLTISDQAIITSRSETTGDAGSVILNSNTMSIKDSEISSCSLLENNGGNAGNVSIHAYHRIASDNSIISTEAKSAGGGKITIHSENDLIAQRSTISTSVFDFSGDGGDINIFSITTLLNHSLIYANSYAGDGGHINIRSDNLIRSFDTQITAISKFGEQGSVNIHTQNTNNPYFTHFSQHFLDNSKWNHTKCSVQKDKKQSSLVHCEGNSDTIFFEGWLNCSFLPDEISDKNNELCKACALNYSANYMANNNNFENAIRLYQQADQLLKDKFIFHKILFQLNILKVSLHDWDRHVFTADIASILQTILKAPNFIQKAICLVALNRFILDMNKKISSETFQFIVEASKVAIELADRYDNYPVLSYIYGYLGEAYEQQKMVSNAMKYTQIALFWAQQGKYPEIEYQWEWQKGRLYRMDGNIKQSIINYQRSVELLQPIRWIFFEQKNFSHNNLFNDKIKTVYVQLADILLLNANEQNDPNNILKKHAINVMENLKAAEFQNYFKDECATYIMKPMNKIKQKTALIYPIPLKDRLVILLHLPDGIKQTTIAVSNKILNNKARNFRKHIENKSDRYEYYAKHLYDILIRPIEKELSYQNIETLIISPDGILRVIPFATLYDGNRFLIEKYTLTVTPSMTFTEYNQKKQKGWNVLLSGTSRGYADNPPLPNVQKEIERIEKITGGKTLLEKDYTKINFSSLMKQNAYSIVHIASHSHFGSSAAETYLLTNESKLTMNEVESILKTNRDINKPLDLLTLSACQTAMGNDQSFLGLAGVAFKSGAKSVVATLWQIDDESTSFLLVDFYKQLTTKGCSKAKALQIAQNNQRKQFKHPFYWSPFLLIGSCQ